MTIALLGMFYVVVDEAGIFPKALLDSIENAYAQADYSRRVAIRVDGIVYVSDSIVRINATNIGSIGVAENDFLRVDVIVVYSTASGIRLAEALRYDASGVSGTWRVADVLTGSSSGEALNPICPCPAAGKGVWDPGETLVIEAYLSSTADVASPVNALVASPYGGYGYR